MTTTDLRQALTDHLDAAPVPAGDLGGTLREGRRRRRRRTTRVGAGALACAAALVVIGAVRPGLAEHPADPDAASTVVDLGPLDLSGGARAYADPGKTLHLGTGSFAFPDLDLDTDAVATDHGIVYFDRGRPMLLGADGRTHALVAGPVVDAKGFHPTAKADASGSTVAWATLRGHLATVTVYDLAAGREVASAPVDCGSDCSHLVIDAIDDRTVFVRLADGTRAWDYGDGIWSHFAGPDTRVADVRDDVVLYTGARPTPDRENASPPWRYVKGPIDAQLTFDGRHVLEWSSRLASTDGGAPITLDQGPGGPGPAADAFWAMDSDGSVLVATLDQGATSSSGPVTSLRYEVYDCVVPSGRCADLGPLTAHHGDPEFIGVDR